MDDYETEGEAMDAAGEMIQDCQVKIIEADTV
jgi:hypothetical protein